MKYLKIQNKGLLDIRLVALMGGTTKSNDQYKIGQFGTGLKYTIAYLFRNNIDFKIFAGNEQINIKTEVEKINETDFEIICINENRTSITTGMGEQWSAWMIIRELWCNALDEGDQSKSIVYDSEPLDGEEGKTTFFIQITQDIQAVIDGWDKYFIQKFKPIWENENYAIHHNEGKENLCLYKNGVLIYQHPNIKSLFVYDIKKADINELREFRGMVGYEIIKALEKPSKEVISYFLNNVTEEHYEGCELDYDWFTQFADVWRETIGDRKVIGRGGYTSYEEGGVVVDYTNIIQLPKRVYLKLTKQFEGVGALAISDDKTEFYEIESGEIKSKVNDCLNLLTDAGYAMADGISIQVGFFNDKSVRVSTNKSKKCLLISELAKTMTNEDLCCLLVENNECLKLNIEKNSTALAKHFIKLYMKEILSEVSPEASVESHG